jgi:hypothetical protein
VSAPLAGFHQTGYKRRRQVLRKEVELMAKFLVNVAAAVAAAVIAALIIRLFDV